jgi:outer membrane protein assembly factor BamB
VIPCDIEVVARLIELDRSAPWEPPERPRPRRPVQRVLATAAAFVVVLGSATASQRPIGHRPAFTVDGSGLVNERSDGHTLFVLRQVNLDASIIDAYRVSDGHPIWARRVGRVNELVDVIRGMLILGVPGVGAADQEPSVMVALDVRDGHEVWRRSDYVPTFTDTGDAIGLLIVASFDPAAPSTSSGRLEAIDVRTGATAWSHVTPAGAIRAFLTLPYSVGELEPDGTLRILDAETGRVTRTARVTNLGSLDPFDVAGDLMTTLHFGPVGPPGVKVFDLVTGRQLWALPLSATSEPLLWCGSVLCGYDGTRTVVVEPRTGQELWRTAPTVHYRVVGGRHLITNGNWPPATREWPTSGAVNDLRTGAVLRDLGNWRVVDAHTWPGLVVLGRDGTDGALVGLMDTTTGHTTVFGRLNRLYSAPTCEVLGDLFVCKAGTNLSAFRVPS